MDKAVELDLCADEAYLKTIEASIDREESIDKLLTSPIGLGMLVNFLNSQIDGAIKKGLYQLEIKPIDFSSFSAPIDILIDTAIIICSRQNYRARLLINGNLLISWKSPAEVSINVERTKDGNFHFKKPDEFK